MSFENEDRLSMLPEEITSHILSLMLTKYAVQTSILSKRWRSSWMPVTNLNLEMIHTVKGLCSLKKFMDRVLQPSQLKLFRFHPAIFDPPPSIIISNWIDKAVRLNVHELDLLMPPRHFPFCMFTCKSLTRLKLTECSEGRSVWELSCPVALPSLRTLDISIVEYPDVNAFKIIAGCPILESLRLKVRCINDDEDDYHFNIPTLKRLELDFWHSAFDHKVVLQVPNLEYLRVGGYLRSSFVMEDVSSLVEASVSFKSSPIFGSEWEDLLKGLSGVRSLSVKRNPNTFRLPVFPNIRHLMLKSFRSFRQIFQFLESFPKLKHLYLRENFSYTEWIEPTPVPACLLMSLTTIKFSTCQWSLKYDMRFLKYILRKAEVLETLTITCGFSNVEEEQRFYGELLNSPRASKCCEISINGLHVSAADVSFSEMNGH